MIQPEDFIILDDLHSSIVTHPATTYYARMSVNVCDFKEGDILVIDKSILADTGDVAVCYLDNFCIREITKNENSYTLTRLDTGESVEVPFTNEIAIWGVITYTIHYNRKRTKKKTLKDFKKRK